MRATLVEFRRATAGPAVRSNRPEPGEVRVTNFARVRLDPGRIASLFGRKPTVVEMAWHETTYEAGWVATASGRWLRQLPHARIIEDALDFQPVGELPLAIARSAP